MKKLLLSLLLFCGCLSSFAVVNGLDPDEIIQFREDPPINNNDDPQAPNTFTVYGKYLENGVLIYGHMDGMISVFAEDETGETIFSGSGNLGEGVVITLPATYSYVKLTVVFGDRTYFAEI